MNTPGRPREFDRDQAVADAMNHFWAHGYRSSSVEDLLGSMGIGKSSFYAAFHSKGLLFQEALNNYCRIMARDLEERLSRAPNARGFIQGLFESVAEEASQREPRGCLIMNSAAEFGGTGDSQASTAVRRAFELFEQLFAQAVRLGQADGSISSQLDPVATGAFLSSTLGGLRALARVGASRESLKSTVPCVLRALS